MKSSNTRLAGVQRQFERWRATKRGGDSIPEELWREAALLCQELSVSEVRTALRVNHTRLKEWVEKTKTTTSMSTTFAELKIEGVIPSSPRCKVTIERPDGARMTLGMSEGGASALVGSFLQCSS